MNTGSTEIKEDNLLPNLLNKSKELISIYKDRFSAALAKGQSQAEAEFTALASVKIAERKIKKSSPSLPKAVPQHMQMILDMVGKPLGSSTSSLSTPSKPNVALAYKNALQPDLGRSLVAAEFDINGRLELVFDDGKKILTKNTAAKEIVEQNVAVQINPVFDYVRFNTVAEKPTYDQGTLFWDKEDHSLAYYNDESEVTLNIGREQLVRVYNHNLYTIDDGQLVYIDGANTSWPTVSLARANSSIDSQAIIGMVTAHIEPHTYGYVCVSGTVHGLNTSQYNAGTVLYLSADVAGAYTDIAPVQPNYAVEVGTVLFPDAAGKIFIRIDKKPWFPSIEIIDNRSAVVLPTVPTVFKPTVVEYNDGFTYDETTGILTTLNNASYTMALTFNATPSASNKSIYFYIEEMVNSVWEIKKYSARKSKLENQTEIQVNIAATKYYVKDTKIRFNIWSDATVSLNTVDLPGTIAGTVVVPAYRFMMAG